MCGPHIPTFGFFHSIALNAPLQVESSQTRLSEVDSKLARWRSELEAQMADVKHQLSMASVAGTGSSRTSDGAIAKALEKRVIRLEGKVDEGYPGLAAKELSDSPCRKNKKASATKYQVHNC